MSLTPAISNVGSEMNTKIDLNSALSTSTHSSKLSEESYFFKNIDDKKLTCPNEKEYISNMNFPQRLMEMLSNENNSDIVTWLPHGKAFLIIKKSKFNSYILPKYFNGTKYSSFTRKLIRWGFDRISKGPETGAYFHRYFQRNNLDLVRKLICMRTRSSVSKDTSSPSTKPETEEATFAKVCEETSLHDSYVSIKEEDVFSSASIPQNKSSALNALDLARDVQNNIHTIKQLTTNIYELTHNVLSGTSTSNFIPAMNPSSDFSISIVKAAEDVLQGSINTSSAQMKKNDSPNMRLLPEQELKKQTSSICNIRSSSAA